VRQQLPDYEPYRAWANFEFIADDGSINEVDLLVLTPKGFYLVEIKSWPGIIECDAGTWIRHHEGRIHTNDNPLLLANHKAKKLKSLLSRQPAFKDRRHRCPYLEERVFLSHENVDARLPAYLAEKVLLRDVEAKESRPERTGIIAELTRFTQADAPAHRNDRPIAKAVTRAMEEAGIPQTSPFQTTAQRRAPTLCAPGPRALRAPSDPSTTPSCPARAPHHAKIEASRLARAP